MVSGLLVLAASTVPSAGAGQQSSSWPLAATSGVSDQLAWRPCPIPELPTRECGELVVPLSYREPRSKSAMVRGRSCVYVAAKAGNSTLTSALGISSSLVTTS
jgi:hypothetical protein